MQEAAEALALGLLRVGEGPGQVLDLAPPFRELLVAGPELQLVDHNGGHVLQRLEVHGPGVSGLGVDHAEGADHVSPGGNERRPRVEANPGRPCYHRVVAKPGVLGRILHNKHLFVVNVVLAEGHLAGRLTAVEPLARLEPETILAQQGYQRDRHVEPPGGQANDALELLLRGRIQDVVPPQCCEAIGLLGGGGVGRLPLERRRVRHRSVPLSRKIRTVIVGRRASSVRPDTGKVRTFAFSGR